TVMYATIPTMAIFATLLKTSTKEAAEKSFLKPARPNTLPKFGPRGVRVHRNPTWPKLTIRETMLIPRAMGDTKNKITKKPWRAREKIMPGISSKFPMARKLSTMVLRMPPTKWSANSHIRIEPARTTREEFKSMLLPTIPFLRESVTFLPVGSSVLSASSAAMSGSHYPHEGDPIGVQGGVLLLEGLPHHGQGIEHDHHAQRYLHGHADHPDVHLRHDAGDERQADAGHEQGGHDGGRHLHPEQEGIEGKPQEHGEHFARRHFRRCQGDEPEGFGNGLQ